MSSRLPSLAACVYGDVLAANEFVLAARVPIF